jgi:uncharacterized protein (DUF427 family)
MPPSANTSPLPASKYFCSSCAQEMKIEIANSKDALILREASYPPVIYIPRKDADMSRLERSEHS